MTFVFKPQAPFERLKLANASPEVALNKAIILQAIIDASNTSKASDAVRLAKKAKDWLMGNSEGFIEVCHNADLDKDFITKIATQLIELHQMGNKKDCTSKQKFNFDKKIGLDIDEFDRDLKQFNFI